MQQPSEWLLPLLWLWAAPVVRAGQFVEGADNVKCDNTCADVGLTCIPYWQGYYSTWKTWVYNSRPTSDGGNGVDIWAALGLTPCSTMQMVTGQATKVPYKTSGHVCNYPTRADWDYGCGRTAGYTRLCWCGDSAGSKRGPVPH